MDVRESHRRYITTGLIVLVATVAIPAPASARHYCASNYSAMSTREPMVTAGGGLLGRTLGLLEVMWDAVSPVGAATAASASCSEGPTPGQGGSISRTAYGPESWARVSVHWNGRNAAGGYERMSDTHTWSDGDTARTYHSCSSATNGGGACGGNLAYTCTNPDGSSGSCDAYAEVRL